jgi:hypothetical protein
MPIRRTSNQSSQDTGFYNPEVYSDVGGGVPILWTPVYINTDLWLDASDTTTITTVGSGVSQWDDKSGKNRNFVQATGVLQPVTNSSSLNNLNVLTFASSYVKSNSTNSTWTFLHNTSKSSIFFVVKPGFVSNPDISYMLLGTDAGTVFRPGMYVLFDDRQSSSKDNNVSSVSSTRIGGTVNINLVEISPSGILPANNWNILGVELNIGSAVASGRCVHYVNGIPFPSSNTYNTAVLNATPSTSLEIGAGGSGVFPLSGNIAEVVIISGALSSGNRQLTEGYLAWKWGLVSGLAAGHPYKNSPPYASI